MRDDDRGEGPPPESPPSAPPRDVLLVGGPTESGEGVHVLRRRDDHIEVGECRPLKEGCPIHGEVVRLTRRPEHERLFDVDVLVPNQAAETSRVGPAQVATETYRKNWDAIFGVRDEPN